jgi:hypothetical protein
MSVKLAANRARFETSRGFLGAFQMSSQAVGGRTFPIASSTSEKSLYQHRGFPDKVIINIFCGFTHESPRNLKPGGHENFFWVFPSFLFILCLCYPSPGYAAGGPDSLAFKLLDEGFEDVFVGTGPSSREIEYENRVYRYEMEAIGRVASLGARSMDPEATLTVIPTNRGVGIVRLSAPAGAWSRFLNGETSPAEFRNELTISTDGSGDRRAGVHLNPSRFKADLAVRPLVEVQIGILDEPFKSGFWLAPEATMSPLSGSELTLQAVFRLRDEFDSFSRFVAPGRTTMSFWGHLPGSIAATGSLGYFPNHRYGLAWEAGRILAGGMLELRLAGDYSGFLKYSRDNVVLRSDLGAWSGLGSIIYRSRGLDLTVNLTAGRFMTEDRGARIDVARRYHESEFGFFAIKTDEGSVGGFRFTVALPFRKQPEPRRLRLTTVPAFPFEYREDVDPIGMRVNLYHDLDQFRKGLYPEFIRNNVEDLRPAMAGGRR